MITAKDFWNKRAAVYDSQVGGIYQDAYDRTVSNSLQYLTDRDRVLEFACGTGIVTCAVAPHVAHLDAIDISANMAQKAQEKADSSLLWITIDEIEKDYALPSAFRKIWQEGLKMIRC